MAAKDVPVVELIEEEEEEWPEAGVQNVEEAEEYVDWVNNVFDHLSTLIHEDTKTALGQTIKNFKKIVVKQWEMMGDADVDVILWTIKDPHCSVFAATPHKRGSRGGGYPEEMMTGPDFIRQLPERARRAEETVFITDIFEHVAWAHEHLAEVCANVSALSKVTE